MLAGISKTPLIWPLLDKLSRTTAAQMRPKAAGNLGLTRIPTMPWDDSDRPGAPWFGQVEGTPRLWEFASWQLGLASLGLQSKRLVEFKTNPRAAPVSEQRREPAVIKPLIPGLPKLPPGPALKDSSHRSALIWPLYRRLFFDPKRIVPSASRNIQPRAAVPGVMGLQYAPKATPQIGSSVPVLPWAARGGILQKPLVVKQLNIPNRVAMITGLTKDKDGNILGSCVVELYLTATDEALSKTTSDANGVFFFWCARFAPATHYLVAYKAGSPDRAGTTLNTLTAVG